MTPNSIEDRHLEELIQLADKQSREALLPTTPLLNLLEQIRVLRTSIQHPEHRFSRVKAWQQASPGMKRPLLAAAYLCCLSDYDVAEGQANETVPDNS